MHESLQIFVERMGLAFEEEGFSRSAGRILGLLLLHDGPFCLEEIAEKIQVSKASVSTNARLLEQGGIIERLSSPGDRRDFYQLASDPWERVFGHIQRRMQRMHDLMSEGFASLPEGEELETARDRLRCAQRFYSFMLTEVESEIERWRQLQAGPEAIDVTRLRLPGAVAAGPALRPLAAGEA